MSRSRASVPEFTLKRVNGRDNYYISWSENRRSKRVSTGTSNKEEALQYLADWIAGWNTPDTNRSHTVNEAIEAYLSYKQEIYLQNKQPERYIKMLEYSLSPIQEAFGNTAISDLLRQHGRAYVKKQLDSGLSSATVRRQLEIFIAALNFVHREGWISHVPAIEKPAPPPPRDQWMTPKQVKEFLSHCKSHHIRLFALLALHTLSRKTAILELTWDQVDLNSLLIDFNSPERHRTKKRRVPVKINKTLLRALSEAKELALTEYVIEYNGKPVQDVKKAFQRLAKSAGMSWVTPHVLRHTGATLLAQSGVSMWEIAGIMGDNIATVEKHYAKHDPEYLKNAVSTLDQLYAE